MQEYEEERLRCWRVGGRAGRESCAFKNEDGDCLEQLLEDRTVYQSY